MYMVGRLALVLAFGLLIAGCDSDSNGGGNGDDGDNNRLPVELRNTAWKSMTNSDYTVTFSETNFITSVYSSVSVTFRTNKYTVSKVEGNKIHTTYGIYEDTFTWEINNRVLSWSQNGENQNHYTRF
jgi:hypothetical protein